MPKRRTRLILIEGLPGSGKTTTAEWISNWLAHREVEVDVERSSELRSDHPVIDRALWKTSRRPDYADRCTPLLDHTRFEILRLDTPDDNWVARQATLANWLPHQCPSTTGSRSD